VLGGFGLQLAGGLDIGHQGEVDVEHVFLAHIGPELADGLQKGQGLDIAHRAADLGDKRSLPFTAPCTAFLISSVTWGMICTVPPR
jgi:hypothetical protein